MTEQAPQDVWTVGRLLQWTTGWLDRHEVDSPRLSAELLIAHALACKKIELYTRFDAVPAEPQLAAIRELVRKAAEHVPIAYIVGRKEFFSLEFAVGPAVLIPRPETETLVQKTIELCRAEPDRTHHVLDLGTGSGCIAVAIARYAANAALTATDVSADAVEVARSNAERHGVADRITFAVADWLDLPAGVRPLDGFDVIVSNPPYIAEAEMASLPRNVRDYEPRGSLTADGSDGLVYYRRLAAEHGGRLRPGGSVLVEIGAGQREDVLKIFRDDGRFNYVGTFRDPGDPFDRVIHVRSRSD